MRADNIKQLIGEFDSRLDVRKEEIERIIKTDMENAGGRLSRLFTLEANNRYRFNDAKHEIGQTTEEVEIPKSPHEDLS